MSGTYYCIGNHPLGLESACQHCQAYVTARYQYWSLDPTQSQYNYNTESTASVKGAVRAFDSDVDASFLESAPVLTSAMMQQSITGQHHNGIRTSRDNQTTTWSSTAADRFVSDQAPSNVPPQPVHPSTRAQPQNHYRSGQRPATAQPQHSPQSSIFNQTQGANAVAPSPLPHSQRSLPAAQTQQSSPSLPQQNSEGLFAMRRFNNENALLLPGRSHDPNRARFRREVNRLERVVTGGRRASSQDSDESEDDAT